MNNRLAALQGVVGSGDVRPTDQAVETFTRLAGLVDVQLAAIARSIGTDLPAVNRLLAARRWPPVPDGSPK